MLRVIFIILLFLISLLTVSKAPAYYLWLLAIAVTEFPFNIRRNNINSCLSPVFGYKNTRRLSTMHRHVLALLLFLSPIVRSYIVASSLKTEFCIAAFGPGSADIHGDSTQAPFNFFKLFKAKPAVSIQKSLVYNKQ
jgi:hypothetical protein